MSSQQYLPPCPENCTAPHSIKVAQILLGVSRSRLYDLMNEKRIQYIETDYGRRIKHDEINRYLNDRLRG